MKTGLASKPRKRTFSNNFVGTRQWTETVPPTIYDVVVTRSMIIERYAKQTGKTEVITFGQAYGELSMWLNVAFGNCSEFGFSDMLAETFFQGAAIITAKAEYRLWLKPSKQGEESFYQLGVH